MIDAVDQQGRRYLEVTEFPEGPLKRAFKYAHVDHCEECNVEIRHGYDRYFQRNNPEDGAGTELSDMMAALTYDAVCGVCGDKILQRDST